MNINKAGSKSTGSQFQVTEEPTKPEKVFQQTIDRELKTCDAVIDTAKLFQKNRNRREVISQVYTAIGAAGGVAAVAGAFFYYPFVSAAFVEARYLQSKGVLRDRDPIDRSFDRVEDLLKTVHQKAVDSTSAYMLRPCSTLNDEQYIWLSRLLLDPALSTPRSSPISEADRGSLLERAANNLNWGSGSQIASRKKSLTLIKTDPLIGRLAQSFFISICQEGMEAYVRLFSHAPWNFTRFANEPAQGKPLDLLTSDDFSGYSTCGLKS